MKNWNLIFRRTHLYLGLLLLPWMALYGVSTAIFNHREYFTHLRPANQTWETVWEKPLALELPAGGQDALRDTARKILAGQGIVAAFGVQRQGQRLVINVPNFRAPLRVTYDAAQQQLRAERRLTSWAENLIRMHERTGYGRGTFLNNVWAVIVDLFCVMTLGWIATGLYLWWKISGVRRPGWLALGAGCATLALLVLTL